MTQNSTNQLLTVKQFSFRHPAFTEGGLRALIFNAETNGFKHVIRRIGGRVLIKEDLFFEWVEKLNEEGHEIWKK